MIQIYSSPSTIPGMSGLPKAEQDRLWKACYQESENVGRMLVFGVLGLAAGVGLGYALSDPFAFGAGGTTLGLLVSGVRHIFEARKLASRRAHAASAAVATQP